MQTKSDDLTQETNLSSSSNCTTKSVVRKSVLARAELWDRRISTNESEGVIPVPIYDIAQWSNEFEKIQNQD